MAAFSPDGKQLGVIGLGGIYLMDADGSRLRRIDPVGDHVGLDWPQSGSGITQTSKTAHYTVQLALDGTGFGQSTAMIMVTDTAGQPVVANEVVLSPVLESMGMAAPETIARPTDPGDYEAKGEFFSMIGEWHLDVRVNVAGNEEVARFTVLATQE